jgi:ribonuclease VapC
MSSAGIRDVCRVSAISAILTREPEADALTEVLEKARSPITSAVAIFETALGICRKRQASVEEGGEDVREFLTVSGIYTVSITDAEAEVALAAFSRYGKGRGHPAQLNLGDCFAYAVAQTHRTTLPFKGDDFDKTDIRPAARSL